MLAYEHKDLKHEDYEKPGTADCVCNLALGDDGDRGTPPEFTDDPV